MSGSTGQVDTTAAEAYETHIVPGMFTCWAEQALDWAAPRSGEHVLDVACGTGIGARVAARKLGASGRIAGLDIDPGVIEVARRLAQASGVTANWHCASALEMPFPDKTFDLALCFQGLQFLPDRVAGFAEIRRVLKDAGRLVATLWGPLECNKGHRAIVQALENQHVDASAARRACTFCAVDEIRSCAAQAGFGRLELRTEDGLTSYASFDSFMTGMTTGSPSTRRAVAQIPEDGHEQFIGDVKAMLDPYIVNGKLAYPMQSHILLARV